MSPQRLDMNAAPLALNTYYEIFLINSGRNSASPSRLGPAEVGGQALGNSLEVHREFAQLRCQAVLYAVINGPWRSNVTFFGCHRFCHSQNFGRRQYPIHGNRVTSLCWTT